MPVINMLTNVQTAEVSLVRRGANNKRFALTKSEDLMPKNVIAALLTTVLATEAEGEDQLIATLKSANTDDEAIEIAVANFRMQTGFKDKLTKEQFAVVAKAAGLDIGKAGHREEDEEEDPKKPGFFRNGKKMPTAKSHTPADMPVEMRKAFDDQSAALEAVRKEAADSKAEVTALRKEGELKGYIAKCVEKYSHVPGESTEDMGDMLQKAYEVSEAFGKRLEAQWEKSQEAIKKSVLLQTQGAAHATQDGSSDWGRTEALAKELKTKDPSLSHMDALSKAMEQKPGVYDGYLSDNPAQTGLRR